MGLFSIFKNNKTLIKKETPITTHSIIVKRKQNKNIYIGQIVSIETDISDNIKFYLSSYSDGYISNKIAKKDEDFCQKYDYAIIRSFDNENIHAMIICCDGYLMRLKVELTKEFKNGDAFIIKDNILFDNNNAVGKIIDNRFDSNLKITFNELDNDRLVVFIRK
jgi:hypothetical protein